MNEPKPPELGTRQVIWRVTIAAAQAAGNMPNHWVVKLEMTSGYVRLIPCATYSQAIVCAEAVAVEYDMGGFVEEPHLDERKGE